MFGQSEQAALLQHKFADLEGYVEQNDLVTLALEPPAPSAGDWKIAFLDAPAI
jgi:hypothetical protein